MNYSEPVELVPQHMLSQVTEMPTTMKNVIILHGTGDSPKLYWIPYLAKNLKNKGYRVWAPQLPNAKKPNIEDWLSFILKYGKFNKDTVLVGHSAGAQLILSILENITVKIDKAVLVSGYAKPLPRKTGFKKRDKFNWSKIRKHVKNLFYINSDNDPWGCTDRQGRIMFDKLGGTLVIVHEGHMGSSTYKQPYKKFPLLLKLIAD